jgi:hypothetical protein
MAFVITCETIKLTSLAILANPKQIAGDTM